MQSLSQSVTATREGSVLVLDVDHPPLNLLSAHVRAGLVAGLDLAATDAAISAVVILCAGRTGFSGADIGEFGAIAQPDLPTLVRRIATSPRPVVVGLHGRMLGGGFELALAATARVARLDARMGLPEIRLGLIPGCGGLERVTRIAGVDAALDLGLSGRDLTAPEALERGLVDRLVEDDLRAACLDCAAGRPVARPVQPVDAAAIARIDAFAAANAFRLRGQAAPAEALALIRRAATEDDILEGGAGTDAFARLEQGMQSRALRHLFMAERRLRDLPFVPEGTAELPIRHVGIVGAGTMGSGIATAMLLAGLQVTMQDATLDGLARGLGLIEGNLAGAVRRGKLTSDGRDAALARLNMDPDLQAMSQADLVIEAVYEAIEVKEAVFARLDAVMRPGAILATNTSFLDIDRIAAATSRPEMVLGMHFFSPAHVMKLLEVVRGRASSPQVVATAMALGRRIGKVAVCVGNCHGFVGNRILLRRQDAAMELLLAGASFVDIDRAMVDFGLPMGPFMMADLAGIDVGWDRAGSAGRTIEEVLCEAGRFGMKNGKGYYDHDGRGGATPSPEAIDLIAQFRARNGHEGSHDPGQAALLAALLDPMLEETGKIIDEGIALRPGDVDLVWVHGYGWPAWRGGPAWWREQGQA